MFEHYKKKVHRCEEHYNNKMTPLDTVGAVCIDADGNCVAGCNSGGIMLKISGRVGQAVTYGAGCCSMSNEERCAAACTTGNGGHLMKTLLSKEIVVDLLTCECAVTSLNNTFKRKFIVFSRRT